MGITSDGHLTELGWTKLPTLMHLAWAAQYDQYLEELQQVGSTDVVTMG